MDEAMREIVAALRGLRRSPRLSIAALACAAVGIGAAVFIATIAHAILLQRLPFPDAPRLVRVWMVQEGGARRVDLAHADAADLQARLSSLEALEWAARTRAAVTTSEGTERVRGESVTPGYFALTGIQPALGRLFTSAEYAPDAPPVIILSDAMWRRAYGSRPDIVGRTVRMRGTTARDPDRLHTVVGVMPPGFAGTVDEDVSEFWLPIEQYSPRVLLERRDARMVWALGLLRAGATHESLAAELETAAAVLASEHPTEWRQMSLRTEPVGANWRERYRPGLLVLVSAAALLLLVSCTNIAHLLLARLAGRRGELAVRMALGAGRWRIMRQLLTESLLLAVAGGSAGALLAWWGVQTFAARQLIQLPAYVRIAPDARVLLFSVGLIALTCILFGALPAWLGARVDAARLREAGRGGIGGRRQRLLADALVVGEIMLTFVLLGGAVLLLRSYANLVRMDPGYRTENLLRMAISLDRGQFPDADAQLGFIRDAKQHLETQPGVRRASFLAGVLPPWFDDEHAILIDGEIVPALAAVQTHAIDEDFLDVMDIALVQGRAFTSADRAGSVRVALVSRTLARALAGADGADIVGRHIELTQDDAASATTPVAVVGIVEDVRYHGPITDRIADHDLYLPLPQSPSAVLSIAIHTTVDAASLISPLQRELGRLAPTSPQHWISTMEAELGLQFASARLYAVMTGVFGASALVLALLGVYGVLVHSVSRRLPELGIRMALGARPADVLRMILAHGARTMLAGVAAGLALSLFSTRLLASLVHGIQPADPLTLGAVAAGLLTAGLVASWEPARRATRADPMSAVRTD